MRELMSLDYDLKFKNNIANIHSISIDTEYTVEDNNLNGNFIITGDYKTNTISINLTDFTFNVPFNHHFNTDVISDSVKIEIEDFVYDAKKDNLNVNIEYAIMYEENEILKDEEEINKIMEDETIDLIDFREEVKGEACEKLDKIDEIVESIKEEKEEEEREEKEDIEEDNRVKNMILESASTTEEEYITYHVYVVDTNDTIETISNKFNVSIDELREYNNFDELTIGMKLIIPCSNE